MGSCGDGICQPSCNENSDTCPADCPAPQPTPPNPCDGATCGDGVCQPECGEGPDCVDCGGGTDPCDGAFCGDGICQPECGEGPDCSDCGFDGGGGGDDPGCEFDDFSNDWVRADGGFC
jgi:hypothetical protein